jgi:hypothetical protein
VAAQSAEHGGPEVGEAGSPVNVLTAATVAYKTVSSSSPIHFPLLQLHTSRTHSHKIAHLPPPTSSLTLLISISPSKFARTAKVPTVDVCTGRLLPVADLITTAIAPNAELQWDRDMKPWRAAQTFGDLLELNASFIEGTLNNTPYSVVPFKEETLRAPLLKLGDLGILVFLADPYFSGNVKNQLGFVEEVQHKPRISFVAPENFGIRQLVQSLQKDQDIDVLAESLYPFELKTDLREATTCRYRLPGSEWLTHADMHIIDNAIDEYAKEELFELPTIKKCSPWVVHVAARNWEADTDVCDLIEKAIRGLGDSERKESREV